MSRPPRLVARPAPGAFEAIAELQRHSEQHFDPASMDARVSALSVKMAADPLSEEALRHELV